MSSKPGELMDIAPTATPVAPRLYAQKMQEVIRELDRVQDRLQALAVEVDAERATCVLSLSHDLLDLQHRAKLLIHLLSMT